MEHSVRDLIGRLSPERRHEERRLQVEEPVLSMREAFGPTERETFRHIERRVGIRRLADIGPGKGTD
ncbi:MAG: hypothetical protein RBU30_04395 [Polyangia bacterium]|nr:hypothetical protein [Polyangia bacterium]